MEKERKEWQELVDRVFGFREIYKNLPNIAGEDFEIPAKIEVGGCACTAEEDIFEVLPLAIYGGWDGNFDPSIKMGELKKEGDVALNVCPTCLGSITWRVVDDTGRAYFELPY